MKHKLYKKISTLLAICFLGTAFAQKFDKKFTENFAVNKDVEVAINASNTEINVKTWNKNEVQVEAFIEIEGVSKEEAEKYFKNWNFEALGNKGKVKITSKGGNSLNSKQNFVFFNDMNFTFPDIEMPNFDAIVLPDMDFDFDVDFESILENIEDLGDNIERSGNYSFKWNDGKEDTVITSKEEWEAFKKTKKYKNFKNNMAKSKEKMKINFAISKEKMKEGLKRAQLEMKNINKEEIKKQLAEAKEQIKNMSFNFNSHSEDTMTINGKKIKIKKRLEIKVPKGATFDLNTRHCKVKLPNTKASGKVSYGSFDANNLNGGKLNISYSPVQINALNTCTLSLNNVTDAKIASVTNTTMSNNSSGVHIVTINENVELSNKFGEITVSNIIPNYQSFNLLLDYTDATINSASIPKGLVFNSSDSSSFFPTTSSSKFKVMDVNSKSLEGNFIIKNKDNSFFIQGKYSHIELK